MEEGLQTKNEIVQDVKKYEVACKEVSYYQRREHNYL